MNAFAGVGDAAADAIMNAAKEGKFLSKEDLKNRAGITKAVMETLEENGVLRDLSDTSQIGFLGML